MIKFYICRHCGNIITKFVDSGVKVICCGEEMQELFANVVDAAVEKHIPVVEVNGDIVNVKVGSVDHPMTVEHHIAFIVLVTEKGFEVKYLDHLGSPFATFITKDVVKEVYAYCNLHGLWKMEI